VDSNDISHGILRLRRTGKTKIFDRCPLLKPKGRRANIRIARLIQLRRSEANLSDTVPTEQIVPIPNVKR
jgi:hypothetical protein